MSKKEIDLRFHYPYKIKNQCPKCAGLLEYCHQAGSLPSNIHCTACGWRDWDKGGTVDFDLLQSMARGVSA
jgi:predicted RNA-binding Zn-ribbon protein involved in translation (DUF1610 family)